MFATELTLTARFAPGEWALSRPLIWQQRGYRIEVPEGFITDLASIPRVFRNVLDVTGPSRRCAVLHDFLYCIQVLPREDADDLFYVALQAEGMSKAQALVYLGGVRVGGRRPWNARAKRGGGLLLDDFVDSALFEAALRLPHVMPTPVAADA